MANIKSNPSYLEKLRCRVACLPEELNSSGLKDHVKPKKRKRKQKRKDRYVIGVERKIFYLNDEKEEVLVRVNDLNFIDDMNKSLDTGKYYKKLKPGEYHVFTLSVPADAITYIKKWSKAVMISYIDPAALSQLPQSPQDQDAS